MEARGSVVSKARLIRRVTTSCVIDELLEEFVRLFSEVTTRLVRERHEVVAHDEARIIQRLKKRKRKKRKKRKKN